MDKLVHNATIDGDAWQPLINYRRILNDEPGGGHGPKARLSTANRGRKRAAPQDGKTIASIYSISNFFSHFRRFPIINHERSSYICTAYKYLCVFVTIVLISQTFFLLAITCSLMRLLLNKKSQEI